MSESLRKDILESNLEPNLERTADILEALRDQTMSISILNETRVGKTLTKCIKTLKRHQRTSSNKQELDKVISAAETLLSQWKDAADKEEKKAKAHKKPPPQDEDTKEGLPQTVKIYHTRLTKQRKELYKDPPVLPPNSVTFEEKWCSPPKRDKNTGQLTFECGKNKDIATVLKDFHPNRTPEEILRAGSFGGTYFRQIVSAVTNVRYNPSQVLKDSVRPEWIDGLDAKTMLTSSTYRPIVNKYKVKCGGSLGMWESSGWIADSDPYGWFQWYCRFFQGRRCSDDLRQIQRWCKSAGPKGRFRSQLCNKILAAKTTPADATISPVIRQTLLHWGLEITEDVLANHQKRFGT